MATSSMLLLLSEQARKRRRVLVRVDRQCPQSRYRVSASASENKYRSFFFSVVRKKRERTYDMTGEERGEEKNKTVIAVLQQKKQKESKSWDYKNRQVSWELLTTKNWRIPPGFSANICALTHTSTSHFFFCTFFKNNCRPYNFPSQGPLSSSPALFAHKASLAVEEVSFLNVLTPMAKKCFQKDWSGKSKRKLKSG